MIERDFILFFGLSGLLSRSSNIKMDARFSGYEFYLGLDYSIFIAYNGDSFDRYVIRFNEMIESCRIIYGISNIIVF
jgi:NADH:ubiquinone oxidoreductase subunit D